jgi:hypothetical protein
LKLLAASPTGSNSISELASKNLAFPSTPVATTCLSPTVLDRHSRTLNHADLGWVRLACRCNCSLNRYGDWDQQLWRQTLQRTHDERTHARTHTHARRRHIHEHACTLMLRIPTGTGTGTGAGCGGRAERRRDEAGREGWTQGRRTRGTGRTGAAGRIATATHPALHL